VNMCVYDSEKDILVVSLKEDEAASENIVAGIIIRRDRESGMVVGVSIVGFKKGMEEGWLKNMQHLLPHPLSLSVLEEVYARTVANSEVSRVLEEAEKLGCKIDKRNKLLVYFSANPDDLKTVIPAIQEVRRFFPERELELSLYEDPEIDYHYPILRVHLTDTDCWEAISEVERTILERFGRTLYVMGEVHR